MALEPCNPKKKPADSYPSPFIEQQPIVRYQVIKESEYTVQLGDGSYDSLNNASILASRLRAAGIACFIEKSQSGGKYRVCVGRYQSKERAQNMLKILANKNIRGGRIVGPFK